MNADETAVGSVLKDYQIALNGSDPEAVLKLYAADGVFMPQHSPSSVGTAAIRTAYEAVVAAITLIVEFRIAEIRQIAPDWVLARTNSAGTAKNNATGAEGPEANQELFLFQKNRRGLKDCALVLLHDKSTADLSKRAHHGYDEGGGHPRTG